MIELDENAENYLILSDYCVFTKIEIKEGNKMFYSFMENKFGKEYLIDLIRHKTGLSVKFLRKKLK